MSEIVCPSCSARFRVPENAIGPEGRRVHCSQCGEIWLARPVTVAASGQGETIRALPSGVAVPDEHDQNGPPSGSLTGAAEDVPESPANEVPPDGVLSTTASDRVPSGEGAAGNSADDEAAPAPAEGRAEEPSWRRVFAAETGRGTAAPPPSNTDVGGAADARPAGATGREEQMAEIRRMLDELQSPRAQGLAAGATAAAAAASLGAPVAPSPEPSAAKAPEPADEPEPNDSLRQKLLNHDARAKSEKPNYDRAKLIKKHARRHRRRLAAEEQRNSSGAFLTGFTLTAAVACTMALVYAYEPAIVARMPQTAPAMQEYVATIDQWRASAGEHYDRLSAKVEQLVEQATE